MNGRLHRILGFWTFFISFSSKSKKFLWEGSRIRVDPLLTYVVCQIEFFSAALRGYENIYVYSDMEKEYILHINPFCTILKGLLIQKIHVCGWKSCGWDYSRTNPVWFGEPHHSPDSSQTKSPARLGSTGGFLVTGGSLWAHSLTRGGDAQAFSAPSEQDVAVFPCRQGMEEVRNLLHTLFVSSV